MSRRLHHRKEKIIRRLHEKNLFPEAVKRGILFNAPQSVLGISDEQLGGMFRLAWMFLEQLAGADAVRAFTLLCQVQPYVAEFWYGLGKAFQLNDLHEEALSAFLMAETIEPSKFEFYLEEIDCCIAINRLKLAEKIMHRLFAHRRSIENFSMKEFKSLKKKLIIPAS